VARRVVEDEQEEAVKDEEVAREEDLSDEEAGCGLGPAGKAKLVVPACEALPALARGRLRLGLGTSRSCQHT
jgi:hypothetical protein